MVYIVMRTSWERETPFRAFSNKESAHEFLERVKIEGEEARKAFAASGLSINSYFNMRLYPSELRAFPTPTLDSGWTPDVRYYWIAELKVDEADSCTLVNVIQSDAPAYEYNVFLGMEDSCLLTARRRVYQDSEAGDILYMTPEEVERYNKAHHPVSFILRFPDGTLRLVYRHLKNPDTVKII